jgi:phage baseplate assembly protein W
MAKTQKYGIKFPTTIAQGKYLFDLNRTVSDAVKSQIIHLVFTPVGQKLRDPDFGTHLIQYIFNPNDSQTWGDIEFDIKDKVKRYVANCEIESVDTEPTENGLGVNVRIVYTVSEADGTNKTYELTQTI